MKKRIVLSLNFSFGHPFDPESLPSEITLEAPETAAVLGVIRVVLPMPEEAQD